MTIVILVVNWKIRQKADFGKIFCEFERNKRVMQILSVLYKDLKPFIKPCYANSCCAGTCCVRTPCSCKSGLNKVKKGIIVPYVGEVSPPIL